MHEVTLREDLQAKTRATARRSSAVEQIAHCVRTSIISKRWWTLEIDNVKAIPLRTSCTKEEEEEEEVEEGDYKGTYRSVSPKVLSCLRKCTL